MDSMEELMEREITIEDLLHLMVERGASDLHLKAGSAPMIRVDGELTPASYEIMTPDVVRRMSESILTDEQKAELKEMRAERSGDQRGWGPGRRHHRGRGRGHGYRGGF